MTLPVPAPLDPRDATQVVADLLARRAGFVPGWLPAERGPDAALLQAVARFAHSIIQRLNQAPEKHRLAFLDMLGVQLIPAQGARAPLVFKLAANAADMRAVAGTRAAAPPPPGSTNQIVFETERALGLASATLAQIVSLWPGRDQYIDHTTAYLAGQPFQPFLKKALQDTPHVLYLAHDTLLALAGASTVTVTMELTTAGNAPLDIVWEYWDGALWREFLAMRPECDQSAAAKLDGTSGLTRSGTFRLQTECAETSKTTVNGVEAFWIRGRLDEPLPPDPTRILPEIDRITLATEIARPIHIDIDLRADEMPTLKKQSSGTPSAVLMVLNVIVRVCDASGVPLRGIQVIRSSTPDPLFTQADGLVAFSKSTDTSVSVIVGDAQASAPIQSQTDAIQRFTATVTTDGLQPDKAFTDAVPVDVSKPFFPLGPQPQPGTAFYFTNAEIFTKPGARLQVYVQTAQAPSDQLAPRDLLTDSPPDPDPRLNHTVAWEYWNGREWAVLKSANTFAGHRPKPDDLTGTGLIADLFVPQDMASRKVNEQDALWMRVRLLSGGYGFVQSVPLPDESTFTVIISQPPALSRFLLGYTWQHGPFHAEHVLAYNDFQYADRTDAARWPGQTFQPYQTLRDVTPTLYIGFDKPLPVDDIGLYCEVLEDPSDTDGPALLWQYWDGLSWSDLHVDDETRNLRVPGIINLVAPDDSAPLARFGPSLHWLRARLKEDGPPGAPTVAALHLNAVWATQQQTITDEPLGASTGQPDQVFVFRQIPVLDGERIEVRELAGARANVEWRVLAMDVSAGDPQVIRRLERALAAEGTQTEIADGGLRLIRDRHKRVTEAWTLWYGRRDFFLSGPHDRHYVLERARGRLRFGDGTHGLVPPAGAAVAARLYRTGGGVAGNLKARSVTQLLSAIGGIEAVFNPRPAEGGADAESLEMLATRGPQSVRHRGRAVTLRDYETLAYEASPAVAVARAIPCRGPAGRAAPGWVTLLILPESLEPRPWPSFGLRAAVQRYVAARATADLAGTDHIDVTGPDYLAVDVAATIVPRNPAEAGAVEQRCRAAVQAFLHPVHGGPDGDGWDLGRDLFASDLAAVCERVDGLDYVQELAVFVDGTLQGDRVAVPAHRIVVAGDVRLKVIEG